MVLLPGVAIPALAGTWWPVALAAAMAAWALLFAGRRRRDSHRRGARIRDGASVRRRTRRRQRRDPSLVSLAGIGIPMRDETKHFKVIGTTGTGKSTAILELVRAALARGDRAVIADPDGVYRDALYDRWRGDVILNPFEADSVRWDPFGEIEARFDADELAQALIPAVGDAAANEWRGYARTLLAALVTGCDRAGRRDARELWRLLCTASAAELAPLVAATPAQPFLDPANERMFGSIRAVAVSALGALAHVSEQRTRPLAVRDWVRDQSAGSMFLPYRARQIASLKCVIATWVRLAIFEALSGPPGADQRLWFVIDELDALGPIDGLKDALARLRKFGGRCVLGFQSLAQVSSTYGAGDAQTLVENCGNTLILRCASSEQGGTAQFASKLIGEREVLRRQASRGGDRALPFAGRDARRSHSTTDQIAVEAAVLTAQIEQLPDFTGYFKGPSSPAWLLVRFGGRGEPR